MDENANLQGDTSVGGHQFLSSVLVGGQVDVEDGAGVMDPASRASISGLGSKRGWRCTVVGLQCSTFAWVGEGQLWGDGPRRFLYWGDFQRSQPVSE